ncbi:hypothetical protein GYA54_02000 [Candidatus Kuenenbacteria bacterium]|nr:hypothetical protein [Candidatus Kuenenbacteria bacterium]
MELFEPNADSPETIVIEPRESPEKFAAESLLADCEDIDISKLVQRFNDLKAGYHILIPIEHLSVVPSYSETTSYGPPEVYYNQTHRTFCVADGNHRINGIIRQLKKNDKTLSGRGIWCKKIEKNHQNN